MNEYPPLASEAATEIAQAYASFGNLSSLYLGQRSAAIHLRLFPLLFEEAEALYRAVHPRAEGEERREDEESTEGKESALIALYRESDDRRSLFGARCRSIVESDPLWVTTQGKRHTTLPESISDPGYVAIEGAYAALVR